MSLARYGFAQTMRDKDAGNIPRVDVLLARALLRGVPPARAVDLYGGVSVRTAYRWRRELVAIESVRVDGWVATFARRRHAPPIRLTAWEAA